jgi:hypothetical protein
MTTEGVWTPTRDDLEREESRWAEDGGNLLAGDPGALGDHRNNDEPRPAEPREQTAA